MNHTHRYPTVLALLAVLALAGCPAEETTGAAKAAGGDSAVNEKPATPRTSDPALNAIIDAAMADLAAHMRVDASAVEVVEARRVTWPDSSAGCPQKGHQYMQVLTPGAMIRLRVGDDVYHYHQAKNGAPARCERPVPPPASQGLD